MSSDWILVEKRSRKRKARAKRAKQHEEECLSDKVLAHLKRCNRSQTPEDIQKALDVSIRLVWNVLDVDLSDQTVRNGNRWTIKTSVTV